MRWILLALVSLLAAAPAARAVPLDFEGLPLFADPSLEDLSPLSFSPAAVLDEVTLGLLVGFQVPGDVPPGSIARSGTQGVVNLFSPELVIRLDTPARAVELWLVSLRGEPLVVSTFDATGASLGVRTFAPLPGPSGFPGVLARITAPGLQELRVGAGPDATSFFLDDLLLLPEPSVLWLLASGLLLARGRRKGRARRTRTWVLVLPALLLLGCPPLRQVQITSPGEGLVWFAPAVRVEVTLSPPLGPGEVLQAEVVLGLDRLGMPPQPEDRSTDLVVAADGASAFLDLADLRPGRNIISIQRRPAPGARASSFDTVTIDRGGFFPGPPRPFSTGVLRGALRYTGQLGVRDLDLVVWYPTESPGAVDPQLAGTLDAPLAPGVAELPALLFSHGNCGIPWQSTFLTAALAQAGWVVIAMSHPGNTFLDPGCNTPSAQFRSFVERPGDVSAALDWLLAESADPAGPLAGAVDPLRVGVAGHSFGGQTALRVPPVEPRVMASLALAPAYDLAKAVIDPTLPLSVPVLVAGGEIDTTTPFAVDQQPLFPKLAAPRFLVEILAAGHLAFADLCANPFPGCPPGVHDLVNDTSMGFLGAYVAGDRRWLRLLEPQPGLVVTADP